MFVLIFVFVIMLLYRKWDKRPRVKYPPLYPGALPIIGHTHMILNSDNEQLYKTVYDLADKCNEEGGVILCKLGWENYYIITDPDDFATAAAHCLKKHFIYAFLKPWLGNGLVSGTDVSLWKHHRKLLSPAFSQIVIDGFINIFNSGSRELVEEFSVKVGKGPFRHAEYLDKMSLESVCQTVFGINNTSEFNTDSFVVNITKVLHIALQRFTKWWTHFYLIYRFTPLKREEDEVLKNLNEMGETVLKTKRKLLKKYVNDKRFKVFLDLALELSEKGLLTDKEVWDEMNTLILAGYETTGNCLMYTLMLIGSHVNVQNKIVEELRSVFGDSYRDVVKQDLSRLVYLEAVLKESLRVYSITPIMLRHVDYDVQLKNYTIPSGSSCLLFTCGLHKHPVWGDDVTQFRPERWLDPAALADPNAPIHKAFAGFGSGKRYCLGKTYSMTSMKITLAHVLRHYRISSDVTQMPLKVDPLLKPVRGDNISIESRFFKKNTD